MSIIKNNINTKKKNISDFKEQLVTCSYSYT